jgi:glycosyltransferase involved in cell wall biosynthesis
MRRNMEKVSVIVPVFNAKPYLNDCIESIKRQTYQNLEIILVDDGSSDGSGELAEELSNGSQNIKTVRKPNGGVVSARRLGLHHATGQWVSFVDADDTLPDDSISSLMECTDGTEMVVGCFTTPGQLKSLSLEESKHAVLTGKGIEPSPWGKLFKRSILDDRVFDIPRHIKYGEDMLMNIRIVFSLTQPPRFVNKIVYNYQRHNFSVSHVTAKNLDYEYEYDRHRIISISPNEIDKYMGDILWIRINGIAGIAISCASEIARKAHPYFKIVQADMDKYQYKMNLKEHIIMQSHNTFIIKILGYFLTLRNGIIYRMKEFHII